MLKSNDKTSDIAVIGMACRFPSAKDYRQFWANLINQVDSVTEIPQNRWDWRTYWGDPKTESNKTNSKWGGFIDDIDQFDPLFFNISPKEANYMDPQHRIFLQTVWHVIEDAGYRAVDLSGQKIGVYVGVSKNDYAEAMRGHQQEIVSFVSTGTVHSILANRVSYLLNLRGKSETVDTACSSSLVALHNAVRDIRLGECSAALVGGVNALITPTMYISHAKSGMLSPDGRCKTFDASANGYVRGEGVGVILIKSLEQAQRDRDHIIGVIKGSAVNHGGRANSLTSPNVKAQTEVIQGAIHDAQIEPETISYIEAHGTATPLGDPIEIKGLTNAFRSGSKRYGLPYCGLGSVKTNIGHLESAAGMAGLIKLMLCLQHRQLPPSLHFQQLNPYIELDETPFFIVDKLQTWTHLGQDDQQMPLRAGVSSFGMGGVNAHIIVEEAPQTTRDVASRNGMARPGVTGDSSAQLDHQRKLIPLSAKSESALVRYAQALHHFLENKGQEYRIDDMGWFILAG
ncbi:polyketide synthase [Chloroflexi bacterium TSY]|nr:polyketide synthase [Chloroflexi bacterium TSY]